MELKKESIQMLRIKNKAAAQATFDEDYNVPDVKPDIGRLVQSKADVSMEEVRLSEGDVYKRQLLYCPIAILPATSFDTAVGILYVAIIMTMAYIAYAEP